MGRVPESARYPAQILGLAVVYTVAGKLGLQLAFETQSVTAVWAPTGIALTALILGGYRLWPGVALGALLTNLNTSVPAITVLGITTGNTLEALTGAYLLLTVARFRPSMERVRDVLALVGFGAGVSTLVSATIGVSSLLAGGEIAFADTPPIWRTWWLGDMGGDLIVAPVLLIAATYRPLTRVPGRLIEAVALCLALVATGVFIFSGSTNVVYLIFPLLTWAALRFWQPGAAGAGLIVASVAVAFTANGEGPFAMNGPDERLLLAQTFVAVAGVTTLVLAAVTHERRRAELAEHDIAETLQQSLIPKELPEVPMIDRAALFRAAGDRHRVGGDFYDLFKVADGRWAVTIGDVVGKGAPAAAMTGLLRHTLRAASLQEGLPSGVLGTLNEAVRRSDPKAAMCTAVYAMLDLDDSGVSVTMSSAGHPLPLILRADRSVEQLGEPGTLLGLDSPPSRTDYTAELAPGESIVFYTDGLTDAYAPEHPVELSEIESTLASHAGSDPEQIIAAIERSLLDSEELEPRDDVAIVVLQVKPGA